MCGRFIISKKVDDITERFHVDVDKEQYRIIYNAAPSLKLPVVTNENPSNLSSLKWGLIPFWAKEPSIGNKLINARAETLASKPSFKNSLKRKRCLVVADGFYEWKKINGNKQAYRIALKEDKLFAFAGLWDRWKDAAGKEVESFTIITTSPNELMEGIHNRMPVILPENDEGQWINTDVSARDALELLKPYPSDLMYAHQVSSRVNNPKNNDEDLIKAI